MKKLRFGTNFTVFVLFFGLAALEAINSGSFAWIGFWALAGILFLAGDNVRKHP